VACTGVENTAKPDAIVIVFDSRSSIPIGIGLSSNLAVRCEDAVGSNNKSSWDISLNNNLEGFPVACGGFA
jgi:hypothetical protein